MRDLINFSARRVGGLMWVRIGRLTFAYHVAPRYRPLGQGERRPKAKRYTWRQVQKAYESGRRCGAYFGA